MTEEHSDARARMEEYMAKLKSIVPPMEHGALESRLEELLNDSSADPDDIITVLHEEFDPQRKS